MTSEEMARRYEAGEHLRQIGDSAGLSHERVRMILLSAGVKMRPRSAGGRRKPAMTSLADETLRDLDRWQSGATLADLKDWLGEDDRALGDAVRTLFMRRLIAVKPI